jgi:hypothetical protein
VGIMQTYDDLVELAGLCAGNARIAHSREVAIELWKMAREYQKKAAKLNGGKLPDIGKPPPCVLE